MDITKQFPKMLERVGGGAPLLIPKKSWRLRESITGKIFQERCVIYGAPGPRRRATRVKTRRIVNEDIDVVDWITGQKQARGKRVQGVRYTEKCKTYVIPHTSWRRTHTISGKIFQERCVEERNGLKYSTNRHKSAQITLDDDNVVDWFTEENVFNPKAIKVQSGGVQEIDITTYVHEEVQIGVGHGGVKNRRPKCMGIDAPCEAINWKGREYYTDEEFFKWKKPKGIKIKELARVDFNTYQRVMKVIALERDVPK